MPTQNHRLHFAHLSYFQIGIFSIYVSAIPAPQFSLVQEELTTASLYPLSITRSASADIHLTPRSIRSRSPTQALLAAGDQLKLFGVI
jgi:hypothetical protein